LGVKDKDFGTGDYQGLVDAMLTVRDFRSGVDQLNLKEAPRTGFIRYLSQTQATLQDLVNDAFTRFQSPGYMIGYVSSENADYLVYDFDGTGLTGIVKLIIPNGYGSVRLSSWSLPTTSGIDLTSPFNLVETVHPASVSLASGQIFRQNPVVSPDQFEHLKLSLKTSASLITLTSLTADAVFDYSVAEVDIQNPGIINGSPSLICMGDMKFLAQGQGSEARADQITVGSDFVVGGSFIGAANGDLSKVNLALKVESGVVTFSDRFLLEAHGVESQASFILSGAADVEFFGGASIKSTGFGALSSFNISTDIGPMPNSLYFENALAFSASGADSIVNSNLFVSRGFSIVSGGMSAAASGDNSTITIFVGSLSDRMAISGDLMSNASASGADSQIYLSSFKGLAVTGALSAEALADDATAGVHVGNQPGGQNFDMIGDASLGSIVSRASGVSSAALIELRALAPTFPSANQGVGKLTTGSIRVSSEALGAKSSASLATPGNGISVGGDIKVLALGSSTDTTADASLELKAGALASDGTITAAGTLNLAGTLEVRSAGAGSYANTVMSSTAGQSPAGNDFTIGGGKIQILAEGADSKAEATLTATNGKSGNLFIQSNMSITADVLLNASGVRSNATAIFKSDIGSVALGGDCMSMASGTDSSSLLILRKTGGNISVAGDASAVSAGDGSSANLVVQALSNSAYQGFSEGGISFSRSLSSLASGASSNSVVAIVADRSDSLTVGSDVHVSASGTQSDAELLMNLASASGQTLTINGNLQLEAMANRSAAYGSITNTGGSISTGAVSLSAFGTSSAATLELAASTSLTIRTSGISATATHDQATASATITSETGGINVTGPVVLTASGTDSSAALTLNAKAGAIGITGDVNAFALADATDVKLTLLQSAASTAASVSGVIRLVADSGKDSVAGAMVTGDLALGKLGNAATDLYIDAAQSTDKAEVGLKLNANGGKVQLGAEGHLGTTTFNMTGSNASGGDKVVGEIDISFSSTSGKAIINFQADQDTTTASAVSVMKLDGFRLNSDEISFGGLSGSAKLAYFGSPVSANSLDDFLSLAIPRFNTATPAAGTTPTLVSKVLVGGDVDTTYLAYDIDGTGISAVVVLDQVGFKDYMAKYSTSVGL
jgi:filamentous hemagglutinin